MDSILEIVSLETTLKTVLKLHPGYHQRGGFQSNFFAHGDVNLLSVLVKKCNLVLSKCYLLQVIYCIIKLQKLIYNHFRVFSKSFQNSLSKDFCPKRSCRNICMLLSFRQACFLSSLQYQNNKH